MWATIKTWYILSMVMHPIMGMIVMGLDMLFHGLTTSPKYGDISYTIKLWTMARYPYYISYQAD